MWVFFPPSTFLGTFQKSLSKEHVQSSDDKIRESGMRGRSTSPGEEAKAGTSGKMSEAIKAKHGRGTLAQRCSAHPHT